MPLKLSNRFKTLRTMPINRQPVKPHHCYFLQKQEWAFAKSCAKWPEPQGLMWEEEEREVCLRIPFCPLILMLTYTFLAVTLTSSKNSLLILHLFSHISSNQLISSTANRKTIKVLEDQGAPSLNTHMPFPHMQSIWGWNSSWRKLGEETLTLQVEATEREAILHSRRIQTSFPALKKKANA